jgi:hypothetical protein
VRRCHVRAVIAGVTLPLCFVAFGVGACFAQMGQSGNGQFGLGSMSQRNLSAARGSAGHGQAAPPPVLPGTKTAPEAVAPGTLGPDALPDETLFDAINRGDIATARDALNRGASLEARNMLGQTPLELSVDLGRNDITFMLLSRRDEDSSSRQIARTGTGVDSVGTSATVAEPAKPVRRPVRATLPVAAAEEPSTPAPRLFSGNGGAAIPAAGFVGFGGVTR